MFIESFASTPRKLVLQDHAICNAIMLLYMKRYMNHPYMAVSQMFCWMLSFALSARTFIEVPPSYLFDCLENCSTKKVNQCEQDLVGSVDTNRLQCLYGCRGSSEHASIRNMEGTRITRSK